MTEASPLSEKQMRLISELFQELPEEYGARVAAVARIREEVQRQLGQAIQESLNEHFAAQPQTTASERRELTYQLNATLRGLGLALKCPNTALPSIMMIDYPDGPSREKTRFRFQAKTPTGGSKITFCSSKLPLPMELIPAPPRIEHFAKGKASENER